MTKVDVRGVTLITLSIANRQFRYRFYVCADARHTILGIDFQEDKHIHLEPGLRVCWINEGGHYTEIPCFSSEEYNKKSKVCMIENYTLEPNTEARKEFKEFLQDLGQCQTSDTRLLQEDGTHVTLTNCLKLTSGFL